MLRRPPRSTRTDTPFPYTTLFRSPDRRERALALLARLDSQAPAKVANRLDRLSPDFTELILGFSFADIVSRPGIDLKTREMLTVAALMAMGTAPSQLEFHIRAALNVGVDRKSTRLNSRH